MQIMENERRRCDIRYDQLEVTDIFRLVAVNETNVGTYLMKTDDGHVSLDTGQTSMNDRFEADRLVSTYDATLNLERKTA